MDLYDFLQVNQKNKRFASCEEKQFYNANHMILANISAFQDLTETNDPFLVIRANIAIRALQNKIFIEDNARMISKKSIEEFGSVEETYFITYMREKIVELPYFQDGVNKLYVPIFSRALNVIYASTPDKLLKTPFKKLTKDYESSIIDCFDAYGYKLFDSFFTKLVNVKESGRIMASYDFDTDTIYFINDQGRLDAKLCLFDKYLHRPSTTHILERIKPVIECYFNSDREGLLKALIDNNLISEKLIRKMKHKEYVFNKQLKRKMH